ncbi:hypothetical protein BGZ47_010420 [Haplosporangium gracile]|nr:hypothetical protein BGZ47_010420 [Haplosporangium gracile]
MGDGGYIYIPGTAGAVSLVSLLNNNAVAQQEVSGHSQFWVYNGIPGVFSNCLAVNKNTGKTDWIPCSTQLPTVCFNSVMRRVLFSQDTSRQIKLDTPIGQVQGWRDQNSFRFLGIPYAEAPIGERRFAPSVPKASFTTTYDASQYGNVCPQTSKSTGPVPTVLAMIKNVAPEDEDCLNLNVYTPSLKGDGMAPLPVMFYIHGGGFSNFSGSIVLFEPGNLVSRGGVVVVTINYRLGLFGWFEDVNSWSRSTVSGNQGLRDQILALQWVQNNIAAFGGDPNRVTLFGESSGGHSVRALLSAPSAFGLYHSVIRDLACARRKSTNDILEASMVAEQNVLEDDPWTTLKLVLRPTADGELIPADFSALVKTGRYNTKANILWGTTKDEAGFYVSLFFPNPIPIANTNITDALSVIFDKERVPAVINSSFLTLQPNNTDAVRDAITRFGTSYFWLCPLQYLSRQMATHKPTYNYRFSRGRDTPLVGRPYCSFSTGRVCHSNDIQPIFASGAVLPGFEQTGDDARFSRQVIDRLTTFAKTGDPNPQPGLVGVENENEDVTSVKWGAYGAENPVLDLNLKSNVTGGTADDRCKALAAKLVMYYIHIPLHPLM